MSSISIEMATKAAVEETAKNGSPQKESSYGSCENSDIDTDSEQHAEDTPTSKKIFTIVTYKSSYKRRTSEEASAVVCTKPPMATTELDSDYSEKEDDDDEVSDWFTDSDIDSIKGTSYVEETTRKRTRLKKKKKEDIWHVRRELPIFAYDSSSVASTSNISTASNITASANEHSGRIRTRPQPLQPPESLIEDFPNLSDVFSRLEDLIAIWHTLALTMPNVEKVKKARMLEEMNERGWVMAEVVDPDVPLWDTEEEIVDELEPREINLDVMDGLSHEINFYELLAESSSNWNRMLSLYSQEEVGTTSALGAAVEPGEEQHTATTSSSMASGSSPPPPPLPPVLPQPHHQSIPLPSPPEERPKSPAEDTLALEMIEDFLSACNGQILHLLFNNYAHYIPTVYYAKFVNLYLVSADAQPCLFRALEKNEWKPTLQKLPFENAGWHSDVTCCVCQRVISAFKRKCCGGFACESCLKQYTNMKVEQEGQIAIPCPNFDCTGVIYKQEVIFRLTAEAKKKFDIFWINASADPSQKTCPRCSRITKMSAEEKKRAQQEQTKLWRKKTGLNVVCPDCQLVWCFACHCPDHQGLSCRSQRKGEKQLKEWAQVWANNQRNARHCPKCKVLTERTDGCPHMDCTKCSTAWCYACGKKRVKIPIIGGHDSRLSILGCDENFLPKKAHLRRFVRGSLFGLAVVAAPPAAVLALGLGIALLPFAGIGVGSFFIARAVKRRGRR